MQPFLIIGAAALLIVKEPDLGTALLVLAVSFSILLFARMKWRSLLFLTLSGLCAAPFLWIHLKEYQQRRILTFLSPDMDPLEQVPHHPVQDRDRLRNGLGQRISERNPNQAAFPARAAHDLPFPFSLRNGGLWAPCACCSSIFF